MCAFDSPGLTKSGGSHHQSLSKALFSRRVVRQTLSRIRDVLGLVAVRQVSGGLFQWRGQVRSLVNYERRKRRLFSYAICGFKPNFLVKKVDVGLIRFGCKVLMN